MLTEVKVSSLDVSVYFTDQNIMQTGDPPMELNFEGLEMQK